MRSKLMVAGDQNENSDLIARPELYSTKRLVEAAQLRGHEVHVINPLECYMNINMRQSSIHIGGRELPAFDAVIPALGRRLPFMALQFCVSLR